MPNDPVVNPGARAHPSGERLASFRLGRLGEQERAAVQAHLTVCPACTRALNQLPDETLLSVMSQPAGQATAGAKLPAPAVTPPGVPPALTEHPRYRVLQLLGTGGMGAVYKAEHRLMQRLVALKVIHATFTASARSVERFRREVIAAARLTHPNIVTAFDAEQVGDTHFLVMEFIEGASLAELSTRRGPLPVAQACNYVAQAALGLQHAFQCGMVHRDIKPQNLMLTAQGRVKILDFGLARFVRESTVGGEVTQEGTVMGTPDYLAPEQAADARHADIRADIYSLGCTLYRLLTGHVPFPGGTLMQKVLAHRGSSPRSLTQFCPALPAELVRVAERMMAKDPARRYPTPADVFHALAPFAGRLPEEARSLTPARPGPPPAARGPEASGPDWGAITEVSAGPPPVARPHTRRLPLSLIAGAVLALFGVLGLVFGIVVIPRLLHKEEPQASTQQAPKEGKTSSASVSKVGKKLAWPADQLQLGKVPAPDLSGKKILYHEAFNNPTHNFWVGQLNEGTNEAALRDGWYALHTRSGTGSHWYWPFPRAGRFVDPFACQLTFRSAGPHSAGGGLAIGNDVHKFRFCINSEGHLGVQLLRVNTSPWQFEPSPLNGNFTHRAIEGHGETNKLLVVVRKQLLEVYVNGCAVQQPLPLEMDLLPAGPSYFILGGPQGTELEIEKVTVWSAEDVPPPDARGAVWK